ncbi:AT-hook motif nuclear-localized protein 10-like isoform X3 [Dendrobium catenatum]|nr:AT-hook motif nuclear-localized protein 10-like isoform X3 [Dendrobium catenatum]
MFDIISLSGALIYAKAGGTVSRTSGLGICLSGVDGRIVGGGVEGPLMAAGPVQVIAGSFLIDVKSDIGATTKTQDFTIELATETAGCTRLISPISMESIIESSRKITSSRGSDDYQNMGGGFHLFHSWPIFPSPHWDDFIEERVWSKRWRCKVDREEKILMSVRECDRKFHTVALVNVNLLSSMSQGLT